MVNEVKLKLVKNLGKILLITYDLEKICILSQKCIYARKVQLKIK